VLILLFLPIRTQPALFSYQLGNVSFGVQNAYIFGCAQEKALDISNSVSFFRCGSKDQKNIGIR
jgi:hypothetical protein